jgi:hypothetical protein
VRRADWAAVVGATVLFAIHGSLFRHWIVDDAGISFAYAYNLIHGHGLVAQAGAARVEGFSNPLWVLLVAPVLALAPAKAILGVKALSLVLVLGTFALVARAVREFGLPEGLQLPAALLALTTLALNTSFVVWTCSGLENPLSAFLVALLLLQLLRLSGEEEPSVRSGALLAIPVVLLALTRPDGICFAAALPLFGLCRFAGRTWPFGMTARVVLGHGGAILLSLAGMTAARGAYFGDLLPNPYRVKGGPALADVLDLLLLRREALRRAYELLYGVFSWRAGLAVAGVCVLVFVARPGPDVRPRWMALGCVLACATAVQVLLPYDWMGEFRFATAFFVVFSIGLAVLVATACGRIADSGLRRAAVAAAAVLLVGSHAKVYIPRSFAFAKEPVVPLSVVADRTGREFNAYADALRLRDGSLLTPDVGGALLYSRLEVHDLGGLCDREIATLSHADPNGLRDLVLGRRRPTFVDIHGGWALRAGLQDDPRFARDYLAIEEGWGRWKDGRPYRSGRYVRRAALPKGVTEGEIVARLRGAAAVQEPDLVPFPRERRG